MAGALAGRGADRRGVVTAGIVVTRWDALPKWGAALLCRVPAAEKILRWIRGEALADGQLATDPVAQRVAEHRARRGDRGGSVPCALRDLADMDMA